MKRNSSLMYDQVGTETLEAIAPADNLNKWIYDTIHPALKGRILEIGTGIGNISKFAIEEKLNITLSDINPEYQDYLQSKFPNVAPVLAIDLQHPDFEKKYATLKESFDCVFLLNVIEHLEDDSAAARNCNFLLAANGNLIILAPSYKFLFCNFDRGLGHFRRYTTSKLAAVVKQNGFALFNKQYFNSLGISGWFLFGVLIRGKQLGKVNMKIFDKLVPLAKLLDKVVMRKIGLSSIVFAKKLHT